MGPCEGAEMSQAAGTSFRQFRAMVRSCASAAPSWWPPPSRPPRGLSFSPLGEGFPGAQGPRQRSATAKRRQSGVMRDGRMRGSLTRPSRPLCVASATLAAIAACLPSDCLNPGSVSSPFGVDRQQSLQCRSRCAGSTLRPTELEPMFSSSRSSATLELLTPETRTIPKGH